MQVSLLLHASGQPGRSVRLFAIETLCPSQEKQAHLAQKLIDLIMHLLPWLPVFIRSSNHLPSTLLLRLQDRNVPAQLQWQELQQLLEQLTRRMGPRRDAWAVGVGPTSPLLAMLGAAAVAMHPGTYHCMVDVSFRTAPTAFLLGLVLASRAVPQCCGETGVPITNG